MEIATKRPSNAIGVSATNQKNYETILQKDFDIFTEPNQVSFEAWEKFNAKQFAIKVKPNKNKNSSNKFNSHILSKLQSDFNLHINHSKFDESFSEACNKFLNYDYINELLNDKNDDGIIQKNIQNTKNYFETLNNKQMASMEKHTYEIFKKSMEAEAKIGGLVVNLASNKQFDELKTILGFSSKFSNNIEHLPKSYIDFIFQKDFSSKDKAEQIALSPIGLVHMFRQYFFELDTFLGTPISHVWLSPGASAELIETTTRKHLVEKNTEFSTESTIKQESSTTDQEELSEAVKQNNKEDIKLGASVTATYSSITASANFNYDKSQEEAKENTHKKTRQQTEKISQELKQSYKTTFKTVTETTDTSSKRYVLSNTTNQLINYEMRRKMRQVAVQVQDIGTYLCWETFVDEPGKTVGLSNLIHIADANDKSNVPDPELIVLSPIEVLSVPFEYNWGIEFMPDGEHFIYKHIIVPPKPNYKLDDATLSQKKGPNWGFKIVKGPLVMINGEEQIKELNVFLCINNNGDGIEDDRKYQFSFNIDMVFVPTQKAKDENVIHNQSVTEKSNQAKIEEAKINYIKATKDRIKLSSKITKRKYEDLREEERIIVYRHLIGNLMGSNNYNRPDDDKNNKIRHNLSEYLNSLFDIDKMLYFVAPEWWKPREHSHQFVGNSLLSEEDIKKKVVQSAIDKIPITPEQILNEQSNRTAVPNSYTANWSSNAEREDNYYITEDSDPAPMGASLGWLIQLDGDEFRNAFLNSPWVKAVIPIRPGKEKEAFEWLQLANVEGIDGLDAITDEGTTILESINNLIQKLNEKYDYQKQLQKVGNKKDEFEEIKDNTTNESLVIDDRSTVLARPINKVYEHGFFPLKNSFAFKPESTEDTENNYYEVFDQWIEILPTDQIVPVPVTYDSITGRMIENK